MLQIIVLRTVQTSLAEAAAKLNSRAGSLYLSAQRRKPAAASGGNGSAGGAADNIFSACRSAVALTTHATIEVCHENVSRSCCSAGHNTGQKGCI